MLRRLAALCAVAILAGLGCGRTNPYRFHTDGGDDLEPGFDAGQLGPDGGPIVPGGPVCNPLQVETYNLPTTQKAIDVLFVVDDSRSMKDNQDALAANFSAFIKAFTKAQVDFHLGTVTTDMVKTTRSGRLVPIAVADAGTVQFLTPQTPNLDTAFASMVRVGINGSGNEEGIAAALVALGGVLPGKAVDPDVAVKNAGFLRPEADFGLVFLSDENDHSTSEPVSAFVTFLKTLKTDTSAMSVAAIVGLEKGFGCNTGSWRYTQVAHAFGPRGLVSACDPDYAATLEAVSGRLVGTLCIVGLTRKLDDDLHLEVRVNGTPWLFFRAAPDSIYPFGSIELLPCPETGGTVEVTYSQCP